MVDYILKYKKHVIAFLSWLILIAISPIWSYITANFNYQTGNILLFLIGITCLLLHFIAIMLPVMLVIAEAFDYIVRKFNEL